jgi:hypothetical protein
VSRRSGSSWFVGWVLAMALGGCASLPTEPLEEGPDIRFPDMNRGQLTLRVRKLVHTEQIFFEGQRLDFLGSPWEREFKLNVNLDGKFSVEVQHDGKRCNEMTFAYSESAPIDSLTVLAGCSRIERL